MSGRADEPVALLPGPDEFPGRGQILIAFSGGVDSVCLAWLVQRSGTKRPIKCIHIDHAIDPDSPRRARAARESAATLGLSVEIRTIERPIRSEADARTARYELLADALGKDEVLLTAHHADDQVETVLLRLLRGAGPRGLGGIPLRRPFGKGWLLRPLLHCSREQIETTVRAAGLSWIDDPTNRDLSADRNLIRHRILPTVRKRWPGADQAVLRSASLCRGAAETLAQIAEDDLRNCLDDEGCLLLGPFLAVSHFRRGQVILAWCRQSGLPQPPARRLAIWLEQLHECQADRRPTLRRPEYCLRAWDGKVWMQTSADPRPFALDWRAGDRLELPHGLGRLVFSGTPPIQRPGLTVRSGRPGDSIRPRNSGHRRRSVDLLRAAGVPPWMRPWWPRIERKNRLVAIGDQWLDERFWRVLQRRGLRLAWERNEPQKPIE